MENFLGFLMLVFAAAMLFYMTLQVKTGTVEFFSVRNFFLIGFIVFQMTSFSITMFTGYYDALRPGDPAKAGIEYMVLFMIFTPLFMLTYSRGWIANSIAARHRPKYGEPNVTTLMALAVAFLIAAAIMRVGVGQVPVVSNLGFIAYVGLASCAAGLAAWAWAPRAHNMFVGVICAPVIMLAMGLSLYQAFGRRDLLSVLIATLWGAYHGHWRKIGLRRASVQIIPLGAGALLMMAAFTAGRQEGANRLDFKQSIMRIFEGSQGVERGDLGKGIIAMASGQAAGACSLWLIDTRPEQFEYDTFHTIKYVIAHPIPRILWEGKPTALGLVMVKQGRVHGKSEGFNFGPGLIGHLKNDNPWLATWVYAIGLGVIFRLMDNLITINAGNPIVVMPLGVALGDVLGFGRGELGLFMARAIIATVGTIIVMKICAGVVGALGLAPPLTGQTPQFDGDDQHVPDDPGPQSYEEEMWDPSVAAAYSQDDYGPYESRPG